MATRKIYIGSTGPFLYDDADAINDPDGDFAGEDRKGLATDGQVYAGTAPSADEHVVRLEDLGARLLTPVAATNIDNPTELNSISGEAGTFLLVYEVNAGLNEYTIYAYDSAGPAVNSPYVVDADGAGSERWIAIAGKYNALNHYMTQLTASRLMGTDGNKMLESKDADDFIDGTVNEITVIDDGDGTVTIEGDGSDTDFTVVTAIQAGGGGGVGFQYKTRDLTLNGGIITTVGAESAWNDV